MFPIFFVQCYHNKKETTIKQCLKGENLLYLVTALKPEAQAFVDKYKLKAGTLSTFKIFYNDNMCLIISGVGVSKSRKATQTLINHYDITDEDTYLNIGICGASQVHTIGTLLEIGSLSYHKKTHSLHNTSSLHLSCVDTPIDEPLYEIVDMESFGFYDAVQHSPAIKHVHILKVVSDHFAPESITKEMTKSLIFNQINALHLLLHFKVAT